MIKAVVFDLDDTLISEREYVLSGFNVVSKEISYRYNLDSSIVFKKMQELFDESSKEVFNRVLEVFNVDYTKEEIIDLINIYRNHKPEIEFYDDVIPTLKELKDKGIKVGIITDGYKETQRRKLDALKCNELFDEIIITDELGREFWKPHEKPYKMMAEKLGVELNEMAYIGDNVAKDFITANKIGVTTVCVEREKSIYFGEKANKEFLPNHKIRKISEIDRHLSYAIL